MKLAANQMEHSVQVGNKVDKLERSTCRSAAFGTFQETAGTKLPDGSGEPAGSGDWPRPLRAPVKAAEDCCRPGRRRASFRRLGFQERAATGEWSLMTPHWTVPLVPAGAFSSTMAPGPTKE